MASSSWTLKAQYGDDTRRLCQWVPAGKQPTLEAVGSGVAKLFDLPSERLAQLRFRYKDGSEDWAALSSDSFGDAMCAVMESRTLRVMADEAEQFVDASQGILPDAVDPWVRFDRKLNESFEGFQRAVQASSDQLGSRVEQGQQQFCENFCRLEGVVAESREQLGASAFAAQQAITESAECATSAVRDKSEQVASGARQVHDDVQQGTSQLHGALASRISRGADAEEPGAAAKHAATVVLSGAALLAAVSVEATATVGALGALAVGAAAVGRRSRLQSKGGAAGPAATAGSGNKIPVHVDADGIMEHIKATAEIRQRLLAHVKAAEASARVASEESAERGLESATLPQETLS